MPHAQKCSSSCCKAAASPPHCTTWMVVVTVVSFLSLFSSFFPFLTVVPTLVIVPATSLGASAAVITVTATNATTNFVATTTASTAMARTTTCRDRFMSPFGPQSIWNTAIGSNATFVPANIYAPRTSLPFFPTTTTTIAAAADNNSPPVKPSNATCANETMHWATRHTCPGAFGGITRQECEAKGCCFSDYHCPGPCPWCFVPYRSYGPDGFHSDHDFILRAAPNDPFVPWYEQSWWGGAKGAAGWNLTNCTHDNEYCHCQRSPLAAYGGEVQLPRDWTSSQYEQKTGNNALAVLAADNETVFQTQPAYRCAPGSQLLSARRGCPQAYPANISILSNGPETALGAHGGSGLSAVGGTVRLHELPAASGVASIKHAIKLELWGHQYYFRGPALGGHLLQPPTSANGGRTQYVWPATGSDGCSLHGAPTAVYNGTNPHLAPGALLAIPSWPLQPEPETELGRKLAWTLYNYGGYLVDDTASDSGAICFEGGAVDAVRAEYGFNITTQMGPWYNDLTLLFQSLHIVTNNGPHSVGGGGAPRQPALPEICK
eukprot:UC1_evm2s1736